VTGDPIKAIEVLLEAYRACLLMALSGPGGEVRATATIRGGSIVDCHIEPARIRPLQEDPK